MLHVLDIFFYLLHLAVVAFSLLGWMHVKTRRLHRWLVGLMAFCWLGIGPLIGQAGFCPLTAIEWRVRQAEGATSLSATWFGDLCARVGLVFDSNIVDAGVTSAFVVLFALTLFQWQLERGAFDRR